MLKQVTLLLILYRTSLAIPAPWVHDVLALDQSPLVPAAPSDIPASAGHKLTGKFLHITDIHPDPFYVSGSNPDEACHHSSGFAGPLGAETTECDSPISLINQTFSWLQHNLRDEIDFIIWTGDSARHDNDEHIPRNKSQILSQNEFVLEKFREVWGKKGDEQGQLRGEFEVPIIPTFGNNDILPHNIMMKGPNEWTKHYLGMWKRLVPEAQRHSFERGGWFFAEVVPEKLAVFSLNTMYFFGNNAGVDGCDDTSEPGYEQFEWLRVQLQLLRERGVKAILTGHVPPARNDQKEMWTESCWMKYTLWMKQYRDVVVGSTWGHMNVEHFFLQDFEDIIWDSDSNALPGADEHDDDDDEEEEELYREENDLRQSLQEHKRRDDDFHIEVNPPNYLNALREQFSDLPSEPAPTIQTGKKKGKKSPQDRYHDAIGGKHAERYAVSFVSASIVPNFYPTIRVFEYNITGLEHFNTAPAGYAADPAPINWDHDAETEKKKKKKKHHKHKKDKKLKPDFTVPQSPSSSSLPGPAYSSQSLSWVGYQQWYANLTHIQRRDADTDLSQSSKHRKNRTIPGGAPLSEDKLREFKFQVEYDTRQPGDVYDLDPKDGGLAVKNMLRLASRAGAFKPKKRDQLVEKDVSPIVSVEGGIEVPVPNVRYHDEDSENKDSHDDVEKVIDEGETSDDESEDNTSTNKKKKKHKKKKKRRKIINKSWYAFVDRALVATVSKDELHREYGQVPGDD